MLALFFLLLAALAYQGLALVSLGRFFKQPLPRRDATETPGITVFKPVRGLAQETRECLESFLTQDYHPYQVLFGVSDPPTRWCRSWRPCAKPPPRTGGGDSLPRKPGDTTPK
jgi:hypothetical protein